MGRLPTGVRSLLIANAIVFVVTLLTRDPSDPAGISGPMVDWLAFWFPRNEHFAVWQVVSYMFMHGGIGHIFFNMFALVSFGIVLEQLWGAQRFLVFYFLCGIGAALVHLGVQWYEFQAAYEKLVELGVPSAAIEMMLQSGKYSTALPTDVVRALVHLYTIQAVPMVGASGSVYGVLVAFGLLFPNAKLSLLFLPVPIAAKYFVPVLVGLDLLSGVTGFSLFGGGIAHFAHLGGALIGFLLMWSWRDRGRRTFAAEEWEE